MVRLTTNQAAEVKNNAASVVALSEDGHVGMLKSRKLLLISLAFALELLGDLLLQDERFQSIITLLLGTSKTNRQTSVVILLLVNEASETAVLTLVVLNLDLEVLSLLGECLSERLEFEELGCTLVSWSPT